MKTEQTVMQIPIEDIIPNRFQPRLAFDEEGLKELSESIKQHGIIQQLVLRRLGNKYEIIAGERRFKAATMAGLKTVPAIISDIDDNQSAEIALVENIQRRNLTPIEEAKSYKNLLDRGYMTQEQLAEKMGVSQSSIANKLRLLNLSPEVQDALLQEKISERHARSLLALPKEQQGEWLQKIINKRMTVRQLDLEIKKIKGEGEVPVIEQKNDIQDIMNNAQDITIPTNNTIIEQIPPTEETSTETELQPSANNKFFNFLENEAANMNMNYIPPSTNDVEVLGDFDTTPVKEDSSQEEEFHPFLFNESPSNTNNDITEVDSLNTIEDLSNKREETIIDPMDAVDRLNPDYERIVVEEQGTDLKTAINEIREFVDRLKEKGFEIGLDEMDLDTNYQFTITVTKKDTD